MRLAVLGSGSAGNAVVVESEGGRLLIDAGFSCRQLEKRFEKVSGQPLEVDALLLTHEHQDHCRGLPVFWRKHEFSVYGTEGTLRDLALDEERPNSTSVVRSGQPFEISNGEGDVIFRVEPFSVPHDAREPVGYVIEDGAGCRLGLAADLGCRSQLAWGRLRDLDALIIEANHDLQMLRNGPYPWHLKQRVASRHGHLSNREAAEGLTDLCDDRLQMVVLYHLSRTNNLPALAAQAMGEKLAAVGSEADIIVTRQDEPTAWMDVAQPVRDGSSVPVEEM